jgi:hypothetical protein
MIDISAYGFDEDLEDWVEEGMVLATVVSILEEIKDFEDPEMLEEMIAYLEMMALERSPITMH